MTQTPAPYFELAAKVAGLFARLNEVEAVALGGSQTGGSPDEGSDIDLYVYTRGDIPLSVRQAIVEQAGGASRASLGLTFWGPGDEWFDAESGIEVDVVYFDADWMASQIQRVVELHQASLGYSTCFWHTVRQSRGFHDPNGWLLGIQEQCQQAYPEALRQNIISLNYPVLRTVIPSYYNQIAKAVKRQDLISINHRLAALFASYFDLLFAYNRVLHPGEKRLVSLALAGCQELPEGMASDIEAVLVASAVGDPTLLTHLTSLLDRLDELSGRVDRGR
jgi:hypothetical protein